jgi:hypothetical protein
VFGKNQILSVTNNKKKFTMFFKINGQLDLSKFPQSIGSLSVVCWDKDFLTDDKLGESIPDATGHFSMLVALSDSGEAYPELYFKVMNGNDVLFTSTIYETKGLLDKNEVTGFIERSALDLGYIN